MYMKFWLNSENIPIDFTQCSIENFSFQHAVGEVTEKVLTSVFLPACGCFNFYINVYDIEIRLRSS